MMARALDANGASKVYILGRREKTLNDAASKAINGSIIPIVADVTSKESLAAAADRVALESGHVDVVVANAAGSSPRTFPSGTSPSNPPPVEVLTEHLWSADISAWNSTSGMILTATHFTVAAFLPLLTKANNLPPRSKPRIRPQIIATSSVASLDRSGASSLAYASAKAGLNHLIKNLSTILAPYHIRANLIAPGFYMSELAKNAFEALGVQGDGTQEGDFPASLVSETRAGTVEDMAGATLFLCSRAGAYINGMILLSDGGRVGIVNGTY